MTMRDDTPYSLRPAGERAREAACFRDILSGAETPDIVLEAFGGVGDTTQVISELWPDAYTVAAELDAGTAAGYAERFGYSPKHRCVCGDTLNLDWARILNNYAIDSGNRLPQYGIVLDYNLLTLKRLRDPSSFVRLVLEAFPVRSASWITFTDAAVGKFHLNQRYYGVRDWDHYKRVLYQEFSELLPGGSPGWALGATSQHSRAMYMRLDRRT